MLMYKLLQLKKTIVLLGSLGRGSELVRTDSDRTALFRYHVLLIIQDVHCIGNWEFDDRKKVVYFFVK